MECSRCLFDTKTSDIKLDQNGICNYCELHDQLEQEYPISEDALANLIQKIKARKKPDQKYDCIIGVSGGLDSTYLLFHLVTFHNLRPLAVHFDNSWNTEAAKHNIRTFCNKLNIDLEEYAADPTEFNDIITAFLKAGVLDIDAPTDIGLITTLYKAADKHRVEYILEGHSFRTEGVQPLNWAYVDGKYIADIHCKFGKQPMKTYPNLWIRDFVYWTAIRRIKRVRPLYYLDYSKKDARKLLSEYGFQDYVGHHYENKWSAFNYSHYLPRRANIDGRKNEICASVRKGILTRSDARDLLNTPLECDPELLNEVLLRLSITEEDLNRFIAAPIKKWSQFNTYKPFFERTKVLWYLLYRANIVPKSFFAKYCVRHSRS
ncbi:hypothetical protein [Schaalia cardiffensis]